MLKIADWATPRSKLVVKVLPAKLAVKPRAHTGSAGDGVAGVGREPQSVVRPRGDHQRFGSCPRELGNNATGRDAPDLVTELFDDPWGTVRSRDDAIRSGAGCGHRILGHSTADGDSSDFVAAKFGELQGAVRTGRYRTVRRGHGILGDRARGGDPSNITGRIFGEPQRAVRPDRDPKGTGVGRPLIFGNHSAGGDPADFAYSVLLFDEPQGAVRSGCNPIWPAVGGRDQKFGDGPRYRDAPDLVAKPFREPQVIVRPARYCSGVAAGCRHGILGDRPALAEPADLIADRFRKPQGAVRPQRDPTGGTVGCRHAIHDDVAIGTDCAARRWRSGTAATPRPKRCHVPNSQLFSDPAGTSGYLLKVHWCAGQDCTPMDVRSAMPVRAMLQSLLRTALASNRDPLDDVAGDLLSRRT